MKLTSILALTILSLGSLAGSARAQSANLHPVQWNYFGQDDHEQREYNSGYRDGSHSGMDDARHGRGFIMSDHGSYRDHRDREYREGYERGYQEAYRANATYRDHDRDHNQYWGHDRDDHDRDGDHDRD